MLTDDGFRLHVDRHEPEFSAAYLFEQSSFERAYGVLPQAHDEEFAPYQRRSVLVSVTDAREQVVGVLRLIFPGPLGPHLEPVKTFVEAAAAPWFVDVPRAVHAAGIDVHRTWDVATLSVDRSIGRHRMTVLGALYHALVRITERHDVRYLLMTVDERVRSTLRMVGLPTAALPGAQPLPFCGSAASTPAWGNCADMLAHQRRHHPEAHRLIRLGIGLSDVEMPHQDAYLLAERDVSRQDAFGTLVPVP